MIPLTLTMRNFLAYRGEVTIDFRPLHLACLTGPNGAGKSSILDAITWALWGRARASDGELIHAGQTDMGVELEFKLRDTQYLVLRKHTRRGKRGHTTLELQALGNDGKYHPVTEGSLRQTQARIEELLRLDYETFANSSFLRQGEADAFMEKTPSKRKEILGNILGLEMWDQYRSIARDMRKEAEGEVSRLEADVAAIEEELAQEPELRQKLEEAQRRVENAHSEVEKAEIRLERLSLALQKLESARRRIDELWSDKSEIEEEIARYEAELSRLEDRIRQYRDLISQRDEIEEGYNRLRKAESDLQALSEAQIKHSGLMEQATELERRIREARARLETKRAALETRLDALKRDARDLAVAAEIKDIEKKVAELERRTSGRDTLRRRQEELRQEAGGLEADRNRLQADLARLRERIEQLESAREPICPLCGQDLSARHRREILGRLKQQVRDAETALKENKRRRKEIERQIADLSEVLNRIEDARAEKEALQRQKAALEERLARAKEAEAQIPAVEAELAETSGRLESEDYAHEERSALAEIKREAERIGYDRARHEAAQAVIERLRPYAERHTELLNALSALPEDEKAADALRRRLDERRMTVAAKEDEIERLQATLDELEENVAEYDEAKAELTELRRKEADARRELGAAEQRVDVLEKQRERLEKLRGELDELRHKLSLYSELWEAFGPNGVPAMVIEAVLPEVEAEANRILARLTNGRMHLRFQTRRELVSSDRTRETLNILISDELGTRDYQLYSGGERFRVSFAVRLAFSRLLARRAGAQLRTLFIDEGFGTQDNEGRAGLVEVLNAIKDEFDRILVITHIDEMHEAFPARIEVTKGPNGSSISVVAL